MFSNTTELHGGWDDVASTTVNTGKSDVRIRSPASTLIYCLGNDLLADQLRHDGFGTAQGGEDHDRIERLQERTLPSTLLHMTFFPRR